MLLGISWTTFIVAYLPVLIGAGSVFYLGLRAVRALERRRLSGEADDLLDQRVAALEEAQLRSAKELEHLQAQQDFMGRLLEQRRAPRDEQPET